MAGELKHGPLALIDDQLPIVFIATKDKLYEKVKNGFEQGSLHDFQEALE